MDGGALEALRPIASLESRENVLCQTVFSRSEGTVWYVDFSRMDEWSIAWLAENLRPVRPVLRTDDVTDANLGQVCIHDVAAVSW